MDSNITENCNQQYSSHDPPQFSTLPLELRLMIWRYAIQSSGEVVEIPLKRRLSGIPLAFVNKEAYGVLNLTTIQHKQHKSVVQLDAVWLRNLENLCPGKEIQSLLRKSKPILRLAITVEVWRHALQKGQFNDDKFWDLILDIGVRELVVVVAFTDGRPTPLGGRFPTGEGRRLEKPQQALCPCVPQSSDWTSWENSEENSITILKEIWIQSQQSRHGGMEIYIPTIRFCGLVASPLGNQTYRSVCRCKRTCWGSPLSSTPSRWQVGDPLSIPPETPKCWS